MSYESPTGHQAGDPAYRHGRALFLRRHEPGICPAGPVGTAGAVGQSAGRRVRHPELFRPGPHRPEDGRRPQREAGQDDHAAVLHPQNAFYRIRGGAGH